MLSAMADARLKTILGHINGPMNGHFGSSVSLIEMSACLHFWFFINYITRWEIPVTLDSVTPWTVLCWPLSSGNFMRIMASLLFLVWLIMRYWMHAGTFKIVYLHKNSFFSVNIFISGRGFWPCVTREYHGITLSWWEILLWPNYQELLVNVFTIKLKISCMMKFSFNTACTLG